MRSVFATECTRRVLPRMTFANLSINYRVPTMLYRSEKLSPPSQDKRWKIVEATMRRQGYLPSPLIQVLHSIQEAIGYLEDGALRYVSTSLHLPPRKGYGVAASQRPF